MIFHLVLLMIFVVNGGNYNFVEGESQIIIYKCDQDSCTKLCKENWGPKLIRAFCEHSKFGDTCTCEHHNVMNTENLLM